MTVDLNNIAFYRQQQVFVVAEGTVGTLTDPTVADAVHCIAAGSGEQQPELMPDKQYRDSRSETTALTGRLPPGPWSINTYLKPSGVLGTKPEGHALLKALFGTETENTGNGLITPVAKTWTASATHTAVTGKATSGDGTNMQVTIVVTGAGVPGTPTITTAGTGYVAGDTVTFADPNGDGADIVCTIAAGGTTFSATKTFKTWTPNSTNLAVGDKSSSGTGTGMVATIIVNSIGVPTTFTITTAGTLYTEADTVVFADPDGNGPDYTVTFDVVGTSVVYSLAETLPSISIWRQLGHVTYVMRGATVDKGSFKIAGNAHGEAVYSGQFMEMAYAGTDVVGTAGIDASATVLPVEDSEAFYVPSGMHVYIMVGSEIMKVTAVDYTNDTLTVTRAQKTTSAAAHAAGAVVSPWHLTGTSTGQPVHGKLGPITWGGVTRYMLDGSFDITNGIQYLIDEKNGSMVASSYVTPGRRQITAKGASYLRTNDVANWKKALARTQAALTIDLGLDSGSIARFSAPYAEVKAPKLGGSDIVQQDLEFSIVASTAALGEELTLTLI